MANAGPSDSSSCPPPPTPAQAARINTIHETCDYLNGARQAIVAAHAPNKQALTIYVDKAESKKDSECLDRHGIFFTGWALMNLVDSDSDLTWYAREQYVDADMVDMGHRDDVQVFIAIASGIVKEMWREKKMWLGDAKEGWKTVKMMEELLGCVEMAML